MRKKKSAETIVESLKEMVAKINVDSVLSEEDISAFGAQLESTLTEKFEGGFTAGYETAERELDEMATSKTKELIEAIDEDTSKKFKEAMDAMDADHAKKFKEAMDALDADHAKKFKEAIDAIDADATAKLKKIIETYEKNRTTDVVVEKLDKFLDAFIKESLPTETIVEQEKLNRLEKFYTTIREQVFISNEEIQSALSERLSEVDSKLYRLEEQLNSALSAKIRLNEELNTVKASSILTEKLKDQPLYISKYVKSKVEDVDASKLEEAIEVAIKEARTQHRAKVDTTSTEDSVITSTEHETNNLNESNDIMASYCALANKVQKRR